MSERSREWLLDTAAVTYIQRGQEPWASRARGLPRPRCVIPVVAYEEQLRGRLAQIRAAETRGDRRAALAAYWWLLETARFFTDATLAPFDELRARCRRVGAQDLKIAAIALVREAVLVTPTVSDFAVVPNLVIEDWSDR